MSKRAVANNGRLQVQGEDMDPELSRRWELPQPPDKAFGEDSVQELQDSCESKQLKLRTEAFSKMKRHILRAPLDGYPAPQSKSFLVEDPPAKARGARVDLEIITGIAFVG